MLRLGFAAMQVEDWEAAAKAYRKYCVYESDVSNQYNGGQQIHFVDFILELNCSTG